MNMITRIALPLMVLILTAAIGIALAQQANQEPYQKVLKPGVCFTYLYAVFNTRTLNSFIAILKMLPSHARELTSIGGQLEYIPCRNCGFAYVRKAWIKWCVIKRNGDWIWVNATQVVIAINGTRYINKAMYRINLRTLATFYRGKWVGTWPFLALVRRGFYIIARNAQGSIIPVYYGATIETNMSLRKLRVILSIVLSKELGMAIAKSCSRLKSMYKCDIETKCGFGVALLKSYPKYSYRFGDIYVPSYRIVISGLDILFIISSKYPDTYEEIVSFLNSSPYRLFSLYKLGLGCTAYVLKYDSVPCIESVSVNSIVDSSSGVVLIIVNTPLSPMLFPLNNVGGSPGVTNVLLLLNSTNAALGSIATTIGERNSGNYITEITTVTAVANNNHSNNSKKEIEKVMVLCFAILSICKGG